GPHLWETCPVRHLLPLLVAVPLSAQRVPPVQYEISVPAAATRLFHVRAEFPARGKDTLYLSLPAWSPGNYEIQNYARYVRHFGAKTPTGQALFWDRFDKDTWRVTTRGPASGNTASTRCKWTASGSASPCGRRTPTRPACSATCAPTWRRSPAPRMPCSAARRTIATRCSSTSSVSR